MAAVAAGTAGAGALAYRLARPVRRADRRAARLAELRTAASLRNPIGSLIDDDRYGPTAGGGLAAIGMAPTAGYRLITVLQSPDLFKIHGGTTTQRYDDWQARSVSYPDGHLAQNTLRVGFMTDAPSFDIAVGPSASAGYRVIVDGLYLARDTVLTATAHGARQYLKVRLDDHGAAPALRRIDVETFSPEGSFGGVAVPERSVVAPPPRGDYRIACVGDSIAAGTGCRNQNDGWPIVAGYLLGGVELDMVPVALGGTGFVNDGPTWRGIRHLDDLTAQPVDEVWIELGVNDANDPPRVVARAALGYFRAVRAALPDAPIVVCGLARDDSERAATLERAIGRAFRFWNDRDSLWIPFLSPGRKVFTGNVEGTGNFRGDVYGGGEDGRDNTHPNVKGHLHLARFVVGRRVAVNI